ncbi:glutathione S-transferase [Xylariomycetidae sp. FL2044]|nr:glutathione S-transferase [Xylariomycetidae sp. FL2044]
MTAEQNKGGDLPVVLYHYEASPYARKVVWYLTLRKIPYTQCLQPPMLPRPDLSATLGVQYRRIPILAIGRDVYVDSRLILRKLETLYPPSAAHPGLSSPSPEGSLIEALLSRTVTDGGIFATAASLIPPSAPVLRDERFLRDRAGLVGGSAAASASASPFSPAALEARRPEALSEMKGYVRMLEETLLSDGRPWILGTEGPSLADIEAVWPLHWLTTMPGALPVEIVGMRTFPRVFGWIERFTAAVKQGEQKVEQPRTVEGEEAGRLVFGSGFAEEEKDGEGVTDESVDLVVKSERLVKGCGVRFWPTDTGSSHKDSGRLAWIDASEVVLETVGNAEGAGSLRVHAPRHGFRVTRDDGAAARL